jgi:3-oxosteroid 1-dehydrogenase
MISFLERQGMKFKYADGWSDYYDERPGGLPRGRSLVAKLFDINKLGDWKDRLSMYPGVHMPMGSEEYPTLFLMKRTSAGKRMAMRLAGRMLYAKLTGKDMRANGAAIQGRMLQMALREKLAIWPETPVEEFVVEGGRVVGVLARRGEKHVRVRASDGVLINAGGFSRNREMREQYGPQPNAWKWTNANPGDTGEMIRAAVKLGAAVDCMEEAWWIITSLGPNESLPEGALTADGTPVPFMHHLDLSLPFSIMVDQMGERFCDEAGPYMEIGQRLYRRHQETGRGIPAWVVMDRRQREYYPWGTASPGQIPKAWLASGYLKKAGTLEELAKLCQIDVTGLARTVARFNESCRLGVDQAYGRGGRAFDRAHGDPTVQPNPNLGPIEQAPFYAVAIYPADVGTAGGVVTDEFARVLRANGSAIPGLYATGNSTASVMGHSYPGAGASIGASFVFGYIAAQHAATEGREPSALKVAS